MGFNVIEQDTQKKELKEYEDVIKLYNKGFSVKKIKESLGLTAYKYSKHVNEALDEGRIKSRQSLKNPKYYYKTKNNKYCIQRRCSETKKMKSYGTYETEEQAKKKVAELIKNNWKE